MSTLQIIGTIILVAFIAVAVYFNVTSRKRFSYYKNVVEGLELLAQGKDATPVEEIDELTKKYNITIEDMKRVRASLHDYIEKVDTKSESLKTKADYAAERADVVRAAVDEVGKGLKKQLVATEQSFTSLEDMTVAIEDLSNRSTAIANQSSTTLKLTEEGHEKLLHTDRAMQEFNQTIEETFIAVTNLGDKSNEIGKIVKVITGISEQINLLALNAAIEAARAGEHGKGFAVVADEVRKLAEQSHQSSAEVASIVQNIQSETSRVMTSMDKGTTELKEMNEILDEIQTMFGRIVQTTKEITLHNEETSASSEELSANAQQILATMKDIAFISQESVEMFEELLEISDDELKTMDELMSEAQNLIEIKSAQNIPGNEDK